MEKIPEYYEIKDSDKKEGISTYGSKSPEEKELSSEGVPDGKLKSAKELAMEGKIAWDKDSGSKPLKSAKELAMEGKIAWDKDSSSDSEPSEAKESDKIEEPEGKDGVNEKSADGNNIEKDSSEDATVEKGENKIEKNEYSRDELLNAAEIFCKYNPVGYKTEEEKVVAQGKALEALKKEHSPEEIAAAVGVADARNGIRGLADRFKDAEAEYKGAVNKRIAERKRDDEIEKIRSEKKALEGTMDNLLKNLGTEHLKTQLKNIEQLKGTPAYDEKMRDIKINSLMVMGGEMERLQDAQIKVNRMVNPKGWDHVGNFFSRGFESAGKNKAFNKYLGMNRSKRTALSAVIFGGAAAAINPVAGLLRVFNIAAGGTLSYFASKKITQRFVGGAYKHDTEKTTSKFQSEALKSEYMGDLDETLKSISSKNIELGSKYATEMRKHKKYRAINTVAGSFATGLVVGGGTSMATQHLLGPDVMGIFGVKKGSAADVIPEKKGGGVPLPEGGGKIAPEVSPETLKVGTVGEGEGVEHVFRRQLELNPEKFGFKGDIADKAAVHQWSGGEAHRIAIDNNYADFGGSGKEVRVLDIGPDGPKGNPAYILETDASGKVSVKEFLDGKETTGGSISRNPYEYLYDKPKVNAEVSPENIQPKGGDADANALYEQRLKEASEPIKVLPIEELPGSRVTNLPDHLELPPSVQRANIFENFEKVAPNMEQTAEQFPKLSLSQQEEILYGNNMKGVAEQIDYLQKNNLLGNVSDHEMETLSNIKENWAEMAKVFDENEAGFIATVKGSVQLNNAGFEKLMGTPIKEIWNIPNGPQFDKFSELMKSVNISSNELSSGKSVGDILRTHFVDGEFVKVPKVSL